jgi:hypothetical protein
VIKDLSFGEKASFFERQTAMFRSLAEHAQDQQSQISYARLAEAFETEEQIARTLAESKAQLGELKY